MNENLPHVTSVLELLNKPELIPWAAGLSAEYIKENFKSDLINIDEIVKEAKVQWKKKRDEAGDRGRRLHSAIEDFLNAKDGSTVNIDEDLEKPFKKFMYWWERNEIETIETECPIWSEDGGGYKGKFDLACYITREGKKILYLIDFKTSPRIYDEMSMQLAAYFYSFKQRTNYIPERAAILRLDFTDKPAEFYEILESELYIHYQAFLKLVEFWHLTNNKRF